MGQLFLITGDDPIRIENCARDIFQKLTGPYPDPFSAELLRETPDISAENVLKNLLGSLRTPPFMGTEKTILLLNFSAFSEEPGRSTNNPSPVGRLLQKLGEILKNGLQENIHLILSGPGVHKQRTLASICEKQGKVFFFQKPSLNDRNWYQEISRLIQECATKKGMNLSRDSIQYLVDVIGIDSGRIEMELEKLYCYAGKNPTLAEVKAACTGNREAHFFAVTQAISERKLEEALVAFNQTLAHAGNLIDSECIRLTRMTANQFRKIIKVKLAMHRLKCQSPTQFAQLWLQYQSTNPSLAAFFELEDTSPWQLQRMAEAAQRFSPAELLAILKQITRLDITNVSSSLPSDIYFQFFITHSCHQSTK